jgi:hypothetical protein
LSVSQKWGSLIVDQPFYFSYQKRDLELLIDI